VLLLPNFQRSFGYSLRFARDDEPPIFMGVQSYRPYNSQPKLFEGFQLIFNFFKRTRKKILKRIAKIQPDEFTTNF